MTGQIKITRIRQEVEKKQAGIGKPVMKVCKGGGLGEAEGRRC